MTVSIQLTQEQTALPKAKAEAVGISAEQYAQQVLQEDLETETRAGRAPAGQHISQAIAETMAETPREELAKLPVDGASQHDHYIYGWPERNG